jgi:hypothetical protein
LRILLDAEDTVLTVNTIVHSFRQKVFST